MQFDTIDIDKMKPDENQPRKYFDPEALEELENSIVRVGLISPIVVCKIAQDTDEYRIVAGERRFRAIKNILDNQEYHALHEKYKNIKVIIVDSDVEAIALIENVQRQNLSHIELAEGIEALRTGQNLKQKKLAELLGKSESSVSELLSLNKLSPQIKEEVKTRNDLPLWKLVEAAKCKNTEKQWKKWKALEKLSTRKELRQEATHSTADETPQEKVFSFKNSIRSINIAKTALKNIQSTLDEKLSIENKNNLLSNIQELQSVLSELVQTLDDTSTLSNTPIDEPAE